MGCCGNDDEPDFSNKGPIKNRSCTDILCCLGFFGFIGGYVIIAIFAWLNGNPLLLLNPTDSEGRICGVKYSNVDLSNKTSLAYFDIIKCARSVNIFEGQCSSVQVCVEGCPSKEWTYVTDLALLSSADVDWTKYICTQGYNPKDGVDALITGGSTFSVALQKIITDEHCAPYYVQSKPVAGRCIPSIISASATTVLNGIKSADSGDDITYEDLKEGSVAVKVYLELKTIGENIFADLTVSWYWILVAIAIAIVVCLFWIVILRFMAGILIWGTILSALIVLGFGVVFTYNKWRSLETLNTSNTTTAISLDISTTINNYTQLSTTWLVIFIILAILFVILLLIVIFLRKRIEIAVAIIKESTKAVMKMLSTLFYPLMTIYLCALLIAFWLSTAIFLASSGQPTYRIVTISTGVAATDSCIPSVTDLAADQKCVFVGYTGDSLFHKNVTWLQVICAFGFLWIINWILALSECTLAGAFASYYWAWDKSKDIPAFPLIGAFARTIRYHTGSLAFGALIIAIIQAIRILLEYAENKLKVAENPVAKFLFKCMKCCFWCLEKIMKAINKNAYIMIAVYGKNFCSSAIHALKLIIRNILRAAVLDNITDFIFFVGKLIVALGVGALSWAFLTNQISIAEDYVPNLNYYWFTIFVIVLAAYITASAFFGTCKMAVDTIFLCFLVDIEKHDGSESNPYYMSKNLMKILGKKNKKSKKKTTEVEEE